MDFSRFVEDLADAGQESVADRALDGFGAFGSLFAQPSLTATCQPVSKDLSNWPGSSFAW
ncbi:hypothetical protein I546_4090 [Mycobacterium kansasii 732]|nr:hypothetical protein I546_4090 [Mycobacterium kansasii 732]KZS69725.1 hypothetical protein A4G27_24725 [Mycobacterium kansasii]